MKRDGHSRLKHLEIAAAFLLGALSALETVLGAGSAIIIVGEALKLWDLL